MKKFFTTTAVLAVFIPGLALAQYYQYNDYGGTLTSDQIRIADARGSLARDQDVLARDRAMGNWWAISGDVWRVRQSQAELDSALASYDTDRATVPRTYVYRTYRY
jgi:hypothetical protein